MAEPVVNAIPPGIGARRQGLDFSFAAINIVLLLLFFFVVTGTIVAQGETALRPPLTTEVPQGKLPRPLLVVGADGNMTLDGKAVEGDKLDQALAALKTGSGVLNIVGVRDQPVGSLLAAVRAAAANGLDVRIVTEPVKAPP